MSYLFLQLLATIAGPTLDAEFWCNFRLLSRTSYSLQLGWEGHQRYVLYQGVLLSLHCIMPRAKRLEVVTFIDEIMMIIAAKQWTGIHFSTRTAHVTAVWGWFNRNRSELFTVRALNQMDKLWEAIQLVYVYSLMDWHTNPRSIYDWARAVLLQ
jgi:hypothetical protein